MIEFQYFIGCPNANETLKNLKTVVKMKDIGENEINVIEVKDLEIAEKVNFQGSPTILIDGYDIYSETKPSSYSYTCRIYIIDGVQTGVLSENYISQKIKKIRLKQTDK